MDVFKCTNKQSSRICLKGKINPIEWDSHDRPIAFGLYTSNGEDILLEGTHQIKRIRKLSGKEVLISGILMKKSEGLKVLRTTKIRRCKNRNEENIVVENHFDHDCYSLPWNVSKYLEEIPFGEAV